MSDKLLSLVQLEAIDAIIDRFEDQWQSGMPPKIKAHLDQLNDSDGHVRKALLIDLVTIDLEERWRRSAREDTSKNEFQHSFSAEENSAGPLADSYALDYPDLQDGNGLLADLVVAEYRARHRHGDQPAVEEYRQRFPDAFDVLQPLLAGTQVISKTGLISTEVGGPDETFIVGVHRKPASQNFSDIGDYRIESEVATGGMGIVYRARHTVLNRNVALKMIKAGELASEQEIRRFRTEAEAAANLDHPNIVSVFEVGEHSGRHFYAMSFVEGQSLSELVMEGPVPQKSAVEICRKTAQAVAYAHLHGVIHRDLKPGNILLDADGQPKVTDFGLARKVEGDSDLTITGQILGTPRFMSPEQAEGRSDVGPAADIYALGAILYYCLTGRAPFQAATVVDTLLQVRNQEPVSPRLLNPEVDRDLETICLKCLHKEAAKRYKSATDLAEDLGRWERREPILARPTSLPERLVKWVRRRPAVASAAMASIVAMFALGAFLSAASYNEELEQALDTTERAQSATEQALGDLSDEQEKTKSALRDLKVQQGKTADALAEANEANRRATRASYYRSVALANEEWGRGNAKLARKLVAQAPAEYASWEYRYLRKLVAAPAVTRGYRFRGEGPTTRLAIVSLSDHEMVASLGTTFAMQNRIQPETVTSWVAREYPYKRISADGKYVAAFQLRESVVEIRDSLNGEVLRSLDCAKQIRPSAIINDLVFAVDSSDLILRLGDSGNRRSDFVLWNWNAETISRPFQTSYGSLIVGDMVSSMDFNADLNLLGFKTWNAEVSLLDVENSRIVRSIETRERIPGGRRVDGIRLSPDGRFVATIHQGIVAIWNVETGELKQLFAHPDYAHGLVFHPEEPWVIVGCYDRIVRVWNIETGTLRSAYRGHNAPVVDIQLSPGDATVFSLDAHGTVCTWDLSERSQEFREYTAPFSIAKVQVDSNGARVYASSDELVFGEATVPKVAAIFDRTDDSVSWIESPAPFKKCMAALPDGSSILCAQWDWRIQRRDSETDEIIARMNDVRPGLMNLEVTPDGSAAVAGFYATEGLSGRVAVIDIETCDLRYAHDLAGNVWDVAVHPTENYLIAAHGTRSTDHGIIALDTLSGNVLFEHEMDGIASNLVISPQGNQFAVALADQTIDVRSLPENGRLQQLVSDDVVPAELAFSPDGKRLAAVTTGGVTLYDVEHRERVMKLEHPSCSCLAFSGNGSILVTGSYDGTLRVWEASE